MCGIVAIFGHPEAKYQSLDAASRILGRIPHRGEPDKQAEMRVGHGWVMGANRLAITSGRDQSQPISSPDGFVTLVFNGEVYNYQNFLTRFGISDIRQQGDGLAIAAALSENDKGDISTFDGMFTIIWVDSRTNKACVVRDRLGIKPLYYATTKDFIVFASEIKALAPEPEISEIQEVAPGTVLEVSWEANSVPQIIKEARFFDLRASFTASNHSDKNLLAAIGDSVKAQCAYAGDIGVYLSGGVDSAGVYCLAQQFSSSQVFALTLTGKNSSDGKAAARLVAESNGRIVMQDCLSENELFTGVHETIRIVESFEPNLVRQSTVYKSIADLATQAGVKVVLCGEGADELFCGYPDFLFAEENWNSLRLSFLESLYRTQLQRVDRMSMHVTTEVRVPYLANGVIALALSNTHRGSFLEKSAHGTLDKKCLRQAFESLLPTWVRLRPKVVLSEGVGLRGNDPQTGMFRNLAENQISTRESRDIIKAFPEWNLKSKEEAYYFKIFHEMGYSKAKFARQRVMANTVHSIRDSSREGISSM